MADFLSMVDKGRVYLFGDGTIRFNPIFGEDLAVVCIDAFESRAETIETGGPETFTLNEIARLAIDALGNLGRNRSFARCRRWVASSACINGSH
jgi:nucleoside-diphosphate-sugar epimerase